jgi:hypothetical protein
MPAVPADPRIIAARLAAATARSKEPFALGVSALATTTLVTNPIAIEKRLKTNVLRLALLRESGLGPANLTVGSEAARACTVSSLSD